MEHTTVARMGGARPDSYLLAQPRHFVNMGLSSRAEAVHPSTVLSSFVGDITSLGPWGVWGVARSGGPQ